LEGLDKFSDLIGTRNCDLAACSIVPQPVTLIEYPKEVVDSIMKPPARNCPSSDTPVYQGTVIIPYIKGIS
jgi:hypothetical protein